MPVHSDAAPGAQAKLPGFVSDFYGLGVRQVSAACTLTQLLTARFLAARRWRAPDLTEAASQVSSPDPRRHDADGTSDQGSLLTAESYPRGPRRCVAASGC